MAKSKHFDKVKGYYDRGLWSKARVRNAVSNPKSSPWITSEEYEEITDEAYEEVQA